MASDAQMVNVLDKREQLMAQWEETGDIALWDEQDALMRAELRRLYEASQELYLLQRQCDRDIKSVELLIRAAKERKKTK